LYNQGKPKTCERVGTITIIKAFLAFDPKSKKNMKRSNLFLGLTTGLLAVASFAFAKSHAKGAILTARCFTGVSNCPITHGVYSLNDANEGRACVTVGQTPGTLRTASACVTPLYLNHI
jgi:hypothetical protein